MSEQTATAAQIAASSVAVTESDRIVSLEPVSEERAKEMYVRYQRQNLPMFDAAARDTLEIDRLRRQRVYWRVLALEGWSLAGLLFGKSEHAEDARLDAGEPE